MPLSWYLKPALLPAALCTLVGAGLILIIPVPLWSLGSSLYSSVPYGYVWFLQDGFLFTALVTLLWAALQAATWLLLMRAWRYHASVGVPYQRHALALPLAAAAVSLTVWLLISLSIWLGLRSATQNYFENPWFPLLAVSEFAVPLHWLKTNLCLYLAWLALWSGLHTPYRQAVPIVTLATLWHLLAILMITPLARCWWLILPVFAFLLAVTLLPLRPQLRDTEAL